MAATVMSAMNVTPPWAGAALTGPGATAFALVVVAYCVLGEPFVGRWLHRAMERDVREDPLRRWRGYARLVVLEVVLGGVALVVAAALSGIGLHRLGLGLPRAGGSGFLFGAGIGVSAGAVLAVVASTVAIWQLDRPIPVVGGNRVRIMVPTRPAERVWFLTLSIAAGICEELLFRGVLLALLAALLHGPSPWLVVLLGAAAFGAAHAYQGAGGMLVTGVLGAILGAVYLTTGSLLLAMVLHALIDARVGLLPARALGGTAPAEAPT
ncbi:MAG: CPBP family intramembrane metalloprotease [Candidatus Dormibacteraeota bacterium]|nr:CPBP family intramembrane metalloprotease [Candidatus Dormibacteraeota bacterium]